MIFRFNTARLSILMTSFCAMSAFSQLSTAQSATVTKTEIMTALEAGENGKALEIAQSLYQSAQAAGQYSDAGYAAFAKAKIYDLQNADLNAAEAYGECGKAYEKAGSAAQSLQCQYQSGLAYLAAFKHGTAKDTLKETAKDLEKIGQGKSALAANCYLALAKMELPLKTDHRRSASKDRKAAIEYADKAIAALEASGRKETQEYLSVQFLKAIALEDMEKFKDASALYKEVYDLSIQQPNTAEDFIDKVETRYNISKAQTMSKKERATLTVADASGNDIDLTVKKKRSVKIPRLNKNQVVDGAAVDARITIDDDGRVTAIEVLKSTPNAAYGEAFEKAVKTWVFTPPAGVSGSNIPPFNYGMTFSVKRR